MEYELTERITTRVRLADADLDGYFLARPHENDTSEWADQRRDLLTEAFDTLAAIVRCEPDVGNFKGVITAYDDRFQDQDPSEGKTWWDSIVPALKDENLYWCVHWEADQERELA